MSFRLVKGIGRLLSGEIIPSYIVCHFIGYLMWLMIVSELLIFLDKVCLSSFIVREFPFRHISNQFHIYSFVIEVKDS